MAPERTSCGELARLFLRLGTTSFGGPAAHIAMMHREVVEERRWLSSQEFLDLLGATNLIPGPNSTEMAIHIGQTRAGIPGLLVAGVSFILPAALFVFAIAWLYVTMGVLLQLDRILYGIKPVAIAIILQAVVELARTAVKSRFLALAGVLAGVANLMGASELAVLFGTGFSVLLIQSRKTGSSPRAVFLVPAFAAASAAAVGFWPILLYFLKVGSVLFGSGYLLVAFLQADLVERSGWLTNQQVLDAIAVGQLTPGPIFTTSTFVGYILLGPWGAVAATIGVFLPAFVFVAITHPFVRRLREMEWAQFALDGINVAAVALMLVVTWQIGRAAIVDLTTGGLTVGAALILAAVRLNSTWLVLGGAIVGLAS
jgi:chromate transporter